MYQKVLAASVLAVLTAAPAFAAVSGATLFKQHCAFCHPDGGNIMNKNKTLHKKDLNRDGIKDWKGVVAKMRNPGPGMTRYDAKAITDPQAKAIGEYVIKTFK
ncbi:c-type cytochrome [Geomesophilobacter sediminis]|uniref:C-type cytochrome n=1 Tax=Geomesophilobacter sediminis TaxID=2798584 RepID=A0A8J7JKM0_9BACT|nr:c-type cytochrome [Geomesophilobacter sediminis]MBJ6724980.1 c-type cytochrome [Geomesophilobacter sediminis]